MKKTVKILTTIIMVVMILSVFASCVLALDPGGITISETTGKVTEIGGKIIGSIRVVGSLIAVGILVVLGIKYMMSSAEGKADFKSTMIPYLVGAVLVFAGSWIASAIYGMVIGLGQ